MDTSAQLFKKSTPRLAKIISGKYANQSAGQVQKDYELSHGLHINRSFIQDLSSCVSGVMIKKEGHWNYAVDKDILKQTSMIAIGRDGTTTHIKSEKYKETMCGTISLYNRSGERLHSIYIGTSPESKKITFDDLLSWEIGRIKEQCPGAKTIGLADGAKDNWIFLDAYTDVQILDYYHATDYLHQYSTSKLKSTEKIIEDYTENKRILKKGKKGVQKILLQMMEDKKQVYGKKRKETIQTCITYFKNNERRMNYPLYQKNNYPIGTGVTEAGCKTLVKQRLSQSGMRWTRQGVDNILVARGLYLSDGRWEKFWRKIAQYGLN